MRLTSERGMRHWLAALAVLVVILARALTVAASAPPTDLAYMRVDIVLGNGTITRHVRLEEGALALNIPPGAECVFLTLDQVSPYVLLGLEAPGGADLTQRPEGPMGYVTPKYAFVNLTEAGLTRLLVRVARGESEPFIAKLSLGRSACLGEVVLQPGESKVVAVEGEAAAGIVLRLALLVGELPRVSARAVNLVSLRRASLAIPSVGERDVVVAEYVIYSREARLVNVGDSSLVAVINATPILLGEAHYRVEGSSVIVSASGTLLVNFPDSVTVVGVEGGELMRRDPILGMPLPPRVVAAKAERPPLVLRVELAPVAVKAVDAEGRELSDVALMVVWPDNSSSLARSNPAVIDYRLMPYVIVNVFASGVLTSSVNLTSFPSVATIRLRIAQLRVKLVDREGRPLPRARVSLFSYATYRLVEAVSDASGMATFERVLLDCNYTIRVTLLGVEVARRTLRLSGKTTLTVECRVGSVTIVVCDERGRRVRGAHVELYISGTGVIAEGTTDDAGAVRFLSVPLSEECRLRASVGGLTVLDAPLPLAKPGKYSVVVSTFRLAVRVRDALGAPVRNATVRLLVNGSGVEVGASSTDDSGTAAFLHVPRGTYLVVVEALGGTCRKVVAVSRDTYVELTVCPEPMRLGAALAALLAAAALSVALALRVKKRRCDIVVIE